MIFIFRDEWGNAFISDMEPIRYDDITHKWIEDSQAETAKLDARIAVTIGVKNKTYKRFIEDVEAEDTYFRCCT